MIKKVILILLALTPFINSIVAQSVKIDSFVNLLKTDLPDTMYINILNELSWEYHRSDVEKCFEYASKALEKSQQVSYQKGEARAYNLQAIVYDLQGKKDKAIEANMKTLEIGRAINSPYHIGIATNDLGNAFAFLSDRKKALEYYHESLAMAEKIKDTLGICFTLENMGNVHLEEGNYALSESYFKRVVEIGLFAKNNLVLSQVYGNLGYLNFDMGELELAREYFSKAKIIAQESNDKLTMASMMMAEGDVDFAEQKFEIAEMRFMESLKIVEEFGFKDGLIYPHYALANIYKEKQQIHKAIHYASKGLAISESLEDVHFQSSFCDQLYQFHEEIGEINEAFNYHKRFKAMEDSLYSIAKSDKVLELETKYQLEKKEVENTFLKKEKLKNEVLLRQQTLINGFIFFGLFMVSILAFLIWKNYRKKRTYSIQLEEEVEQRTEDLIDTNKQLKTSNEELEKFAYIASHDLKEPLRNISGFAKLIERELRYLDNPKVKEYIAFVEDNTKQMYALIEDVLEYSRLNFDTNLKPINTALVIDKVKLFLDDVIKEKNAILFVDELPVIYSNSIQLFQLFKNLIENGMKYNESEVPTLQIKYQEKNDFHQFIVADNGIGIDPKYHDRIFGMFKRLHNRSEYNGSGLGLSIVKKIIDALEGEIRLESSLGKGCRFIIRLPKCYGSTTNILEKEALEQF